MRPRTRRPEREYLRDRTIEGHESARKRGKTIDGAGVTDDHMLSMALHLREQGMSLRNIAARHVITTGTKKGQHPSPATVMRMLREHDEQTTAPMASQATGHPPPPARGQDHCLAFDPAALPAEPRNPAVSAPTTGTASRPR
ncbi:hypothetical protein PV733_09035 [Streptomyces europaeiscabiei]|uniref:hypothetical protein n=1 Tax=Streptomyces europaeiscabiei TaxID=146819 RepID=UPI0029B9506E|nr:hypothetical protein [Streptomyces europaeiscabiei]MDX3709108.1 hypothetical protein [Streptomyces europaeiscabiei]